MSKKEKKGVDITKREGSERKGVDLTKRQKLYRAEHGRAYEISGQGHPTVHHSKRPSKYEAKREEGYVDREYNINDPKYKKMGKKSGGSKGNYKSFDKPKQAKNKYGAGS